MSVEARAALRALCAVGAVALLVMLPEWVMGPTVSHSLRYNLVWTEQFRDLVREGVWYPRWLPRSWDGLGSPTFYFYPPLWFWMAAAIDAVTGHFLSVAALVTAATATAVGASGVAMWLWLRSQGAERPTIFAIAYMVAPYHLYDIYVRGALAETLGYAMLPLAAFALSRLAQERRGGIALLAFACAALLLTHLPTAFIAGVLLLTPYALVLARSAEQRVTFMVKAMAGGVLGIGIAAFYWLPIVWLTPAISLGAFTGPFFTPSSWFFWAPSRWLGVATMQILIPLTIGFAALSLLVLARDRQARFWAILALIGTAMVAGLIPFVWHLPGFVHVQFPSRCLVLVEFSALTAIALAWLKSPVIRLAALTFAVFVAGLLLPNIALRVMGPWMGAATEIAEARDQFRDAPEYLPTGFPIAVDERSIPDPSRMRLPHTRGAHIGGNGAATVDVAAHSSGFAIMWRFYYPFWRVTDEHRREVPIFAAGRDRLLAWRVSQGRHRFQIALGPARGEREGVRITVISLLAAFATLVRRQRR